MKIDSRTAAVSLGDLELCPGLSLEYLKVLRADDFDRPVISNSEWQTYRIVDPTASSHLVFRDGRLWQIRIALVVDGDRDKLRPELLERERHAAHEAFLLREIGATKWRCPDGSRIELYWDERNLASSIVVTYAAGDSV